MKDAVRDPAELCRLLDLPDDFAVGAKAAARNSFRCSCRAASWPACGRAIPTDPLLRQVLPIDDEMADVPGFVADPVDDAAATRQAGLLQKYDGRVLMLVTTGTCAVHCRYCFRRHFPYDESPRSLDAWQPALDEIADDTSPPRSDPQRRRPAHARRCHARGDRSSGSKRSRICAGCEFTRGCRS